MTNKKPTKKMNYEAIKKLLAKGEKLPKLYLACGKEDFLLENDREFHKFLEENNVKHVYWEAPGNHNPEFWDKCVQKFIPEIFS